jgi:protein-S-isoprenylcysteine O-methyltransferase Ste14
MSDAIDPRVLRPEGEDEPTAELIREALEEAGTLAKLEVALAREEIRTEVARVRSGAIALGVAGASIVVGVAVLLAGVALVFSPAWLVAVCIGGGLLLAGTAAGLYGWRALPRQPMNETKDRIESNIKQLRERVA